MNLCLIWNLEKWCQELWAIEWVDGMADTVLVIFFIKFIFMSKKSQKFFWKKKIPTVTKTISFTLLRNHKSVKTTMELSTTCATTDFCYTATFYAHICIDFLLVWLKIDKRHFCSLFTASYYPIRYFFLVISSDVHQLGMRKRWWWWKSYGKRFVLTERETWVLLNF